MKATDGCSSISVDGVTVNGKHQLLYTITKGVISVFEKGTALQDKEHVKEADVLDILQTIKRVKDKYGGSITQGSMDNAATSVMNMAISEYGERNSPRTRTKITSSESTPKLAYLPIIQAL